METEGGLFIPETNGRLTVYSPTQHGYKDRFQLARILGDPGGANSESYPVRSAVRLAVRMSSNVQPFGALMALKTALPIKMHNSRRESVIAGIKRHPMRITMKTGTESKDA